MKNNRYGFCQCGCGQRTSIAIQDDYRYGWIKGKPKRFIYNHTPQCQKAKLSIDDIKKIREYYIQRPSITNVAQRVNLSQRIVRRILLEEGIKLKNHEYWLSRIQKFHTGERHHNWKGGKIKSMGYILIKHNHPRTNKYGYIQEHIIIWESFHKMRLPDGYLIHHLNGIKDDNRPENLVAMKKGEHINQTEPFKKRIKELEDIIDMFLLP